MPGDFDVQEVPGLGPPGVMGRGSPVLGQRCAGSVSCSRSVAVRSRRGHRSQNCSCRSVPNRLSIRTPISRRSL